MNAEKYTIVKDFVQEALGAKHPEDFMFDPLYKAHPKQDFPDLAYEIASRVVNRFDFVTWDDIEKQDHWIWNVIGQELDKIALEEDDWDNESWMVSPHE
jgi:hypothetical protein